MNKYLISTADLKLRINKKEQVIAKAKPVSSDLVAGYLLHLTISSKDYVLSTWRSDKPRLFKRSDALLSEVAKFGIKEVIFEI